MRRGVASGRRRIADRCQAGCPGASLREPAPEATSRSTAFGITPDPIGDEEIINYNVPAFEFAGKTFTAIGVDSNGYLVAGGATSEDNNCCNLPAGPDAAPPNNVIAPFWTDLDGTGAQGILRGDADGRRRTRGSSSSGRSTCSAPPPTAHFQVWIGVNGVEDISMAYDPAALPADPAGQDFLVGAENEVGQGEFLPVGTLPTTDLLVESTDPAPGQSLTYQVVIRGERRGEGTLTTTMQADGVLGTTIVKTDVEVTRR